MKFEKIYGYIYCQFFSMETTYRVTRLYQKSDIVFLAVTCGIMILGCVLGMYTKEIKSPALFFCICFVMFFLFQFLPFQILNWNYHSKNDGDELICDFANGAISYSHLDEIVKFNVRDIYNIRRFMSIVEIGRVPKWHIMWYKYNYCNIVLDNGRNIIITSLLVPDMNKFIEDLNIDNGRVEKIGGFYNIA